MKKKSKDDFIKINKMLNNNQRIVYFFGISLSEKTITNKEEHRILRQERKR